MDRRNFIQMVAPAAVLPLSYGQPEGSRVVQLQRGKYLLFYIPKAMDGEKIVDMDGIEIQAVPVDPRGDQNIDDCVRLYELKTEAGDEG